MPDYTNLKGFDTVFDSTPNNEIQDNIVEFLNWGLLEKGNYFNVTLGEMGSYFDPVTNTFTDVDYSKLKLAKHSYLPDGQVWESFRKNWVWESGVNYSPAPLVSNDSDHPGVSGVYVDSTFYPSDTTGAYAHNIDHFNGRVVFQDPIPTGSLVQVEYSYKYINTLYASNLPYIRELQVDSLSIDRDQPIIPPEMRVQLPAIAVEIVPSRTFKGYQLGGGQYIYTDILFHCLAENAYTRNQIIDMVSMQNEKTIFMFNTNSVASSGDFPVDAFGYLVPEAKRYPDLIESHKNKKLTFLKTNVQNIDVIDGNFYAGIVRSTTELIQTNI